MLIFRRYELVLGFLFGIAVCSVLVVVSQSSILQFSSDQKQQQSSNNAVTKTNDQNFGWDNWTKDPISVFTFALTIFNGLLFISTFFVWLATRKSAKISERALTQLERPHLRIAIAQNNFKGFWDALASSSDAPIVANGTFDIVFINYGKYPAFTKTLHWSVVHSASLPIGEGTITPLSGDPIITPSGQTVKITGLLGGTFSPQEAKEIRSSSRKIWFFGSLSYGNVIGIGDNFTTNFLWVYDGPNDTWSPSNEGGPDRNCST